MSDDCDAATGASWDGRRWWLHYPGREPLQPLIVKLNLGAMPRSTRMRALPPGVSPPRELPAEHYDRMAGAWVPCGPDCAHDAAFKLEMRHV